MRWNDTTHVDPNCAIARECSQATLLTAIAQLFALNLEAEMDSAWHTFDSIMVPLNSTSGSHLSTTKADDGI